MLRQLKNDSKLYGGYVAIAALLALIGGAVGTVLTYFMVEEGDPTWPCVGTVMALLMLGVSAFLVGAQFASELRLAIAMGCTRTHFFMSFLLRALVMYAAGYAVVLLVNRAEVAVSQAVDPVRDWMPTLAQLTDWRWVLGVLLPLLLLPPCCALLVQRFGKPVSVTLWITWILCCILPSRLIDSLALDRVAAVPAPVWWGLYALVLAAMAVTMMHLLRRYTVR